ncbi:hypothetical protein H6G80_32025 [Nostoc sp. FACHB-87]|uniref:hypothetical protein n=1 Tax=Nostocales TaxID=1161 RepID=UPI0016860DD7|nr:MULTISPECIES: hypothetical protein [Nostocales]MBD2302725.1 hypothetical protein [Nostoc sp. FACHB-190]MBD2458680.1 hypothetical protein [Nostoc sp. FACHB-87]MBD2479705.1 hypothetical protein [Anabaena sp. FACHB-83]MBD2487625.1 hypothetical protein [Aulosira sp. FACHB-615]
MKLISKAKHERATSVFTQHFQLSNATEGVGRAAQRSGSSALSTQEDTSKEAKQTLAYDIA